VLLKVIERVAIDPGPDGGGKSVDVGWKSVVGEKGGGTRLEAGLECEVALAAIQTPLAIGGAPGISENFGINKVRKSKRGGRCAERGSTT